MVQIIDGRALALEHEQKLKNELSKLDKRPKVVSILIGDDPASVLYTKIKQKKAADLGIDFEVLRFKIETKYTDLLDTIKQLNEDKIVNGIMVQLPIPDQFLAGHEWEEITKLINPGKDIDGLTPNSPYLSATAKAVISILEDEQIEVRNKKVVIIGKSDLVGKPIARELTIMGAVITVVDRKTPNPAEVCSKADILISAAGSPYLVKKDWVKEGVVIVDVGTSELGGKIVGDIDPEVYQKAGTVTPSPGGVGPMTVISLMENIVLTVKT